MSGSCIYQQSESTQEQGVTHVTKSKCSSSVNYSQANQVGRAPEARDAKPSKYDSLSHTGTAAIHTGMTVKEPAHAATEVVGATGSKASKITTPSQRAEGADARGGSGDLSQTKDVSDDRVTPQHTYETFVDHDVSLLSVTKEVQGQMNGRINAEQGQEMSLPFASERTTQWAAGVSPAAMATEGVQWTAATDNSAPPDEPGKRDKATSSPSMSARGSQIPAQEKTMKQVQDIDVRSPLDDRSRPTGSHSGVSTQSTIRDDPSDVREGGEEEYDVKDQTENTVDVEGTDAEKDEQVGQVGNGPTTTTLENAEQGGSLRYGGACDAGVTILNAVRGVEGRRGSRGEHGVEEGRLMVEERATKAAGAERLRDLPGGLVGASTPAFPRPSAEDAGRVMEERYDRGNQSSPVNGKNDEVSLLISSPVADPVMESTDDGPVAVVRRPVNVTNDAEVERVQEGTSANSAPEVYRLGDDHSSIRRECDTLYDEMNSSLWPCAPVLIEEDGVVDEAELDVGNGEKAHNAVNPVSGDDIVVARGNMCSITAANEGHAHLASSPPTKIMREDKPSSSPSSIDGILVSNSATATVAPEGAGNKDDGGPCETHSTMRQPSRHSIDEGAPARAKDTASGGEQLETTVSAGMEKGTSDVRSKDDTVVGDDTVVKPPTATGGSGSCMATRDNALRTQHTVDGKNGLEGSNIGNRDEKGVEVDAARLGRADGDAKHNEHGNKDFIAGEAPEPAWIEGYDAGHDCYYYHHVPTGESSWYRPDEPYQPYVHSDEDEEGSTAEALKLDYSSRAAFVDQHLGKAKEGPTEDRKFAFARKHGVETDDHATSSRQREREQAVVKAASTVTEKPTSRDKKYLFDDDHHDGDGVRRGERDHRGRYHGRDRDDDGGGHDDAGPGKRLPKSTPRSRRRSTSRTNDSEMSCPSPRESRASSNGSMGSAQRSRKCVSQTRQHSEGRSSSSFSGVSKQQQRRKTALERLNDLTDEGDVHSDDRVSDEKYDEWRDRGRRRISSKIEGRRGSGHNNEQRYRSKQRSRGSDERGGARARGKDSSSQKGHDRGHDEGMRGRRHSSSSRKYQDDRHFLEGSGDDRNARRSDRHGSRRRHSDGSRGGGGTRKWEN